MEAGDMPGTPLGAGAADRVRDPIPVLEPREPSTVTRATPGEATLIEDPGRGRLPELKLLALVLIAAFGMAAIPSSAHRGIDTYLSLGLPIYATCFALLCVGFRVAVRASPTVVFVACVGYLSWLPMLAWVSGPLWVKGVLAHALSVRRLDLSADAEHTLLIRFLMQHPFSDANSTVVASGDEYFHPSPIEGLSKLWDLNLSGATIRGNRFSRQPVPDRALAALSSLAQLRTLDLTDTKWRGRDDHALVHLEKLTKLECLSLSGASFWHGGLGHLRALKELRGLDLGFAGIPDAGLILLKGLTKLRWLSLRGNWQVTGPGLAHLEGLTELRAIDLHGTGVRDAGLRHLAGLPKLEALDLSDTPLCGRVGPVEGRGDLAQLSRLNSLKRLILPKWAMDNNLLFYLKGMTSLQDLEMNLGSFKSNVFSPLRSFDQYADVFVAYFYHNDPSYRARLAELERESPPYPWRNIPEVTVDTDKSDLAYLKDLRSLRALSFFVSVTNPSLSQLKGLSGLTRLKLEATQVTGKGFVHLESLPSLRHLALSDNKITDAGLIHIGGLTGLKRLELSEDAITGEGLVHIAGLPALETLDVTITAKADAGLLHIGKLRGLKELHLRSSDTTDAGLVHLAGLTRLQELTLEGHFTDAGLVHLSGLTALKELRLKGTEPTDAGLVHLEGLTGLQTLYLNNTKITDAGLASLRIALPQLRFYVFQRRPLGLGGDAWREVLAE